MILAPAAIFVVLLVSVAAAAPDAEQEAALPAEARAPANPKPAGIVVPKRSALIAGLDHSFKQRANKTQSQKPPTNSGAPSALAAAANPPAPLRVPARLVPNILWFTAQRRQQQLYQQQQQQQQQSPSSANQPTAALNSPTSLPQKSGNLFLERHHQEILAANPTIATSTLLTRSDAPNNQLNPNNQQQQQQQQMDPNLSTTSGPAAHTRGQSSAAPAAASPSAAPVVDPQQYRGYSLIELEIRTEADRRFVQDLYGNLSAALNEQASSQTTLLSPYVDIDFWSFQPALDDHIDIMVSPKSRAFIQAQLTRAKIRHRTKIDDIQSRLDAQLAPTSGFTHQQQQQQQQPGQSAAAATSGQLSGRAGQQAAGSQTEQLLAGGRQSADAGPGGSHGGQSLNDSAFFENYQRLADINEYLESIVERNRDVAKVQVIGRSSQGRYLRVLKLGYDQSDVDGSTSSSLSSGLRPPQEPPADDSGVGRLTPGLANGTYILENFFRKQEAAHKLGSIWLDGGTHAREWISPATTLYLSFRLADNHQRCVRFFDTMRALVLGQAKQQQQILQQLYGSSRSMRRRLARRNRAARSAASPPAHSSLDADLITGINEINSSLLGKPAPAQRPRTELEHTLELLAKSPQDVASEYGCDLELDQLLRRYTFLVMPVLNPDGYEYSHTHNRLWRKTRSTSNHPIYRHFCLGADPNRNYDARHGSTGSSSHPCSQTYGGSVPFTEPETRHQSNFVYANRMAMKMFISFHSYSQMILLPYSHSKQLAPDHKDLESVGLAAVKAIERTHGTVYRVGPSASILYTASGTASDWAYEKAGIKYSYTIELRDTGTYGFLLPRNQIVPTGEETFNGLLAMIEQMEKNDNLLTSKSMLRPSPPDQAARLNATHKQPADLSHVPLDLDQMEQLGKRHKTRPVLENAVDGSDSWATPKPMPTGVRDRARPAAAETQSAAAAAPAPEMERPKELAAPKPGESHIWDTQFSAHRLEDEPTGEEPEPDSGYAFEGEGELMEPTRDNIIEAAKMSEAKLTGRLDSTRRIVQAAGLTASGRNYINSPLLASRTTPSPQKRESSDNLVTEKSRRSVGF